MQRHRVKRFSIVPLSSDTAVAIIVTDNGHVENRLFELPKSLTASHIEKMVNILNDRLVGVPLVELHTMLEKEALSILRQHVGSVDSLVESLASAATGQAESKVFYGGKTNMLNQPEFHDLNKIRMLLELMDTTESSTVIISTK